MIHPIPAWKLARFMPVSRSVLWCDSLSYFEIPGIKSFTYVKGWLISGSQTWIHRDQGETPFQARHRSQAVENKAVYSALMHVTLDLLPWVLQLCSAGSIVPLLRTQSTTLPVRFMYPRTFKKQSQKQYFPKRKSFLSSKTAVLI